MFASASATQNGFTPLSTQEKLFELPDAIREAFFGGEAFGGKSDAILWLPIVRRFYEHPKYKGIILRRTFPELERELLIRAHAVYPSFGAWANKGGKEWIFPSGARQRFGHAQHENDIRDYDSDEYNLVSFDELTKFTSFQYLYMFLTRLRSSSPDLPAIARSTGMPGDVGHGWVKDRFIKVNRDGNVVIKDPLSGFLRIFIKSSARDNIHGMRNDPDYVKGWEQLPEHERRAKQGDWDAFEGQVFEDFRPSHIPGEPDNAVHVIPDYHIPEYYPRILSVDWGHSAATVAQWFAVAPKKRVILYRERMWHGEQIANWATELGAESEPLKSAVLDTNAWNDYGEPETIADQIIKYSGISFGKASKDRVSGKMLIQDYLRWKPKPITKRPATDFDNEYAASLLRLNPKTYALYLNQFKAEEPEDNLPRLQIFESVTANADGIVNAIPKCVYATRNKEDIAEFDGDDPIDALRYGLKRIHLFFNQAAESQSAADKMAKIEENLSTSGDYNKYYRQLKVATHARHRAVKRVHVRVRR